MAESQSPIDVEFVEDLRRTAVATVHEDDDDAAEDHNHAAAESQGDFTIDLSSTDDGPMKRPRDDDEVDHDNESDRESQREEDDDEQFSDEEGEGDGDDGTRAAAPESSSDDHPSDACGTVGHLTMVNVGTQALAVRSTKQFSDSLTLAQRQVSWTIARRCVRRLKGVARGLPVQLLFLASRSTPADGPVYIVLRRHANSVSASQIEPHIQRVAARLRGEGGLPRITQWSFMEAAVAAEVSEMLSNAGVVVLPVLRVQSYASREYFVVQFGANETELQAAALEAKHAYASEGSGDFVVIGFSAADHNMSLNDDFAKSFIKPDSAVPGWMRSFFENRIVPFLMAPLNQRPVRLYLDGEMKNIPLSKIKEFPSVVRAIRYEKFPDYGGAPNRVNQHYLRRSVRHLCEEFMRQLKANPTSFEFDFLLENRFTTSEIVEIAKIPVYVYAEVDKECLRLRGFTSARADLVREGYRLMCLPNQRVVLASDEVRDLKSIAQDFLRKSSAKFCKVPFGLMFHDDIVAIISKDFPQTLDVIISQGNNNEIHLIRNSTKIVQSVTNALAEWAKNNFVSGSLAFRIDDIFESDVFGRVKAFAQTNNLSFDRTKEGRIITFTVKSQRRESRPVADSRQYDPLPHHTPPPSYQADPHAQQSARPLPPVNPYTTYPPPQPQPTRSLPTTQQSKDLYSSIAQAQHHLPPGFTCRLVPQRNQLMLLDHVRRHAVRTETGEALTTFGSAIAAGIQQVRLHMEHQSMQQQQQQQQQLQQLQLQQQALAHSTHAPTQMHHQYPPQYGSYPGASQPPMHQHNPYPPPYSTQQHSWSA